MTHRRDVPAATDRSTEGSVVRHGPPNRTIGILGGMGPVATQEFLGRILARCERIFGAVQDGEYPPILLYSMSLSGSDESGIRSPSILAREFRDGLARLERGGCDFVVIPCNTAHELLARLRATSPLPILSIIDLTVAEVLRRGYRRVGLLASESTLDDGLYARPLSAAGVASVIPGPRDRRELVRVVLDIMGGHRPAQDRDALTRIAARMHREDGIDAVIMGCTELSVVQPARCYPLPAVDAMDVLAVAAVDRAYGVLEANGEPLVTSESGPLPRLRHGGGPNPRNPGQAPATA